jgi:hypothetical protein
MTGIKSVFQKFLSSSRRRATLSQSLLSNFAQIIDAAYGFVVIPLSITYVGLDTYGWWLISFGIIQVFMLMDGGLSSAFQSRLTHAFSIDDSYSVNKTLSINVFFSVCVAVILAVIATAYSYFTVYIFGAEFSSVPGIQFGLILSAIAGSLAIVNANLGVIGTASLKPRIIFIPSIFARIIGLLFTVFLFFLECGIISIPIGALVTEAISLGNCIYQLKIIKFKFIKPDTKALSEWGSILRITFIARFSGGLYTGLEPTLVGYFASPAASAVYVTCKKPATLLAKIFFSLWASLVSPLISYSATDGFKSVSIYLSYIYALFLRLIVTGFFFYIILNDHFLRVWVGPLMFADKYLYMLIAALLITGFIFDVINESFLIVNLPKTVAANFIAASASRLMLSIAAAFYFGLYGLLFGVILANLITSYFIWVNLCKKLEGHLSLTSLFFNLGNFLVYIAVIAFYVSLEIFSNILVRNNYVFIIFVISLFLIIILLEYKSISSRWIQ